MIKIFLSFFLVFIFLKAEDSEFIEKQKLLLKVKTIIQEEESIARAYENFIINEKKLPLTFSELITDDYLGTTFSLTSFDASVPSVDNFRYRKTISNRLKDTTLEDDTSIKSLYESDLFRKKTYYYDDETIAIKLEDDFANHLYFLSSTGGFNLIECGVTPKKKYCTQDDDIYIYEEDAQTNLLMYYAIDNFKMGPIIITTDTSLYASEEFNYIPRGALLYDTDTVKYIKTTDSIEVIK